MPRLIMFDIDGTLTATNEVDTECYVRAMSERLGVPVNSDWSSYRHVTDSGIAAELFEKHPRQTTLEHESARAVEAGQVRWNRVTIRCGAVT